MIRTGMLKDGGAPSARQRRVQIGPGAELYLACGQARICRPRAPLGEHGRQSHDSTLLALALLFAAAIPAVAQASPPAGSSEPAGTSSKGSQQATARAHFDAAMDHYRARRYREAIRELELSAARAPSAEIWFDIARAHEQLGEIALAVESYRLYLRDRVDAPDAREVTERIALLAKRAKADRSARVERPALQAALAIDATQQGALVLLDGRELGVAPLDRIVELAPGRHRLDVSRAGYVPFRAELELQPGALSAAYVDMRPLTRLETVAPHRVWTWVAASAGVGALLTSGVLGIVAIRQRDEGNFPSARRWAEASDLVLGGALALAVAATVLYFAEGHHSGRAVGARIARDRTTTP
jgi:tetratricopeptide (TPR) repeat protein